MFAMFLLIAICYILEVCSVMEFIHDKEVLEDSYALGFTNVEQPPDDLCDLPKRRKLAICYEIIKSLENEMLDPYQQKHKFNIYFNKAAAYHMTPDCVENRLTFRHKKKLDGKMQNMFPCYGRHEPMRTNWDVDDNIDVLFLSGGPVARYVYVYMHKKLLDNDIYEFYKLAIDVYALLLPFENISWTEMQTELNLLDELSINVNIREVEINYVREVVKKEIQQYDPICDLERENKIILCKYFFDETALNDYYSFDEVNIENRSVDCVENFITFEYLQDYNNPQPKQKMYPCHGLHSVESTKDNILPLFFIAGGYRPRSILVYITNDGGEIFNFFSFIENINQNYIPLSDGITLVTARSESFDLSSSELERLYIENFLVSDHKPDSLCDIPTERKSDLCETVIQWLDNEIILDSYGAKFEIYFNRNAAIFGSCECVKNKLTFSEESSFNDKEIMQNMFPCHGRNNPLRTYWDIDDSFDILYLSEGPVPNSVYVYVHIKLPDDDVYEFYELITNIVVSTLPPLFWDLKMGQIHDEINLLDNITKNENIHEIEVNYIREVIKKDVRLVRICDLKRKNKISVCKYLQKLIHGSAYVYSAKAFQRHSLDCEENPITFKSVSAKHYNNAERKQKMYPCYAVYRPKRKDKYDLIFYISEGYRTRSALIYVWNDEKKTTEFHSFVENILSEDMPPFERTPLSEVSETAEITNFEIGETSVQIQGSPSK